MTDLLSRRILIRIAPGLHDACKERARREGRSLASLIRMALTQYLESPVNHRPRPPRSTRAVGW